jgi:hypothetical protein
VKLMVVDGLNEQSGHWPLPWHVERMLAWCDQVTARNPVDAAEATLAELAQDEADLGAVGETAALGRKLLEKASPEDARVASEKLKAVEDLMEGTREAFAAALVPESEASARKNGPWATQFRIAQRAFGPKWREALPGVQKEAARQTKAVEDALKGLSKGTKKSYAKALDALKEAFLGDEYDHLLLQAGRYDKPAEAAEESDRSAFRAIEAELKRAVEDGRKAAQRLWQDRLKAFREERSGWLAPYGKSATE